MVVEPGAGVSGSVERARAGDADAFEGVYRAHVGRVYALCLRMSGDNIRAGELTQDVFIRAWDKLDTFRGESAFGSWLHRLATNVVLGALRSERRRSEEPLEHDESDESALPPLEPRPDLGLDLDEAIRSLPPMARQVVVLHDIEGYEHAEIGAMLGIAEGTSKAHCFRARRLLRERLSR
ncbi:MAG TPA: RNA polymerase sigma factor [Gemmatimonadales bacterium]|jgi:RNA polymerase sigma-70 factor (ECF subfamily)